MAVGAGTIVHVLRSEKPLIVVVNALLQDNHQQELARKLHQEGYLVMTDIT
jgi:UDP-N-acetylglucosamine transferase subunit ALG13